MDAKDGTKVLVVMALIRAIIEDGNVCVPQKGIRKQFTKVLRWTDESCASLGIKSISSGAKRDLTKYSAELFGCRNELLGDKVSAAAMTQELIASVGLVTWICTKFKLKGRCWRYLDQTLTTLTCSFVEAFKEHEDCELYLKFDKVLNI